jgi:hypothetical protein
MKRDVIWIAGAGVAIVSLAVFLWFVPEPKREVIVRPTPAGKVSGPTSDQAWRGEEPPALGFVLPESNIVASKLSTQVLPEKTPVVLNEKTQKVAQVAKPKSRKVIQDPVSRDALELVGLDPDAEMYWLGAIQNPNLPQSERQDLIDDLNEHGLPDPKHPTMEDLPLILRRLAILEAIVPTLPEGFDWKEPYSDLVNLAEVAMGGGKEVH